MKFLITSILIFIFFSACQNRTSEKKQFDYNSIASREFNPHTDKKQLIYEILNRAFVEKKDIPDYNLIKNKKRIFISDFYLPNFEENNAFPLNESDIPGKINNVEFMMKSDEEIQNLADETDDFLYSTISHLQINGNKAQIGLSNNWIMGKKNEGNYGYTSGGSYILSFKKVNGRWVFDDNADNVYLNS